VACRAVLTESRARKEWPYNQYAVAVLDRNSGIQFLNWDSIGDCSA